MKAVKFDKNSSSLRYGDFDPPTVSEGQKVGQVSHSALNHRDIWITKGLYPNLEDGVTLGSDGLIGIDGLKYLVNPGLGWGEDQRHHSGAYQIRGMPSDGTFAELIAISPAHLLRKPAHLSDCEAAALPLAGLTAYRVLINRCNLQKGEHVLISGIGGGVALFAMQFAIASGAAVWVTSSSRQKIEKAMELGAQGGVLYTEDNWHKTLKKQSGGFDIIIDSAAGDGFAKLVSTTRMGARVGIYGGTRGKINSLSPQIIFWRHLSIMGSTMGSDKDFADMIEFVEKNKIRPIVDSTFALSEYQEAFERMESGKQFGKIVFKH